MSDEHWFDYRGERHQPFYHMYNLTHLNERMVELAIAFKWLMGKPWSQGLEVGNVTGHYQQMTHDVIDLYEERSWYQTRQRVINEDMLEIQLPEQYPWVCSLSTVEHTEDPIEAIKTLSRFVAPGGSLLVSFPTGVRLELDALAYDQMRYSDQFQFNRYCTIAREDNDHGGWAQTPEIEIAPYGPWANSVFIGEWET